MTGNKSNFVSLKTKKSLGKGFLDSFFFVYIYIYVSFRFSLFLDPLNDEFVCVWLFFLSFFERHKKNLYSTPLPPPDWLLPPSPPLLPFRPCMKVGNTGVVRGWHVSWKVRAS